MPRSLGFSGRLPLFVLASTILLSFFVQRTGLSRADKTKPKTNAAIAEFEPAFAVRGSACITCHAKIRPSCITDFGYRDRYFFGHSAGNSRFGPFDGSIYGDFFGGEPNKTAWLTAEISGQIIVPRADLNLGASAGKLADQPVYQKALQAKSLAQYLQVLENQKANPAAVIEKGKVFIGAPNSSTLEARFNIVPGSGIKFKFVKNSPSSPDLVGIESEPGGDFYTNVREVVCDGDLFIRGTVFLNEPTIVTQNGCRIYSTGPIFLQKEIHYRGLDISASKPNLQLVSAEAILLGVGDKSCDAKDTDSPLSRRLVSGYAVSTFMTRSAESKSISPPSAAQSIYAAGKRIPFLEDAGCHDDTIDFSRLLLNSPQVHNRYKGTFKGVIIAEIALFRLSKSDFEFDPVFKDVPVLPLLRDSDYLEVK